MTVHLTSNQYFITTHSASLMDTPGAEVYHVRLKNGASIVDRVSSDSHRSEVCEDLGYHPSDLLQANCIIWVEGPSDRMYLNWWMRHLEPSLIEGIHFSIMFYGGRLAAHLSGDDIDDLVSDFISLRRLNRRGAIVIDSDKANPNSKLNATKQRLKREFDTGPGFAWITRGREIENYLQPHWIQDALAEVHPSKHVESNLTQFDNCLTVKSRKGVIEQANKMKIANTIVSRFEPDYARFDLLSNIERLLKFIKESNPGIIIRH